MSILITLLIGVLVFGLIYYVLTMIPLPPPFKSVALIILAIIFIIWLLRLVGFVTF